jgi:hypothetical protein
MKNAAFFLAGNMAIIRQKYHRNIVLTATMQQIFTNHDPLTTNGTQL